MSLYHEMNHVPSLEKKNKPNNLYISRKYFCTNSNDLEIILKKYYKQNMN